MTETPSTNATILTAIAAAMGDIQKVGKSDRNKHDGYSFASIDSFLSLVNPICAKHGLVILSDEVSREDFTRKGRSGETPWMRMTFSFTVYHIEGQYMPPVLRTAEVLRNGAQAYGSAQSYCLKQFLRGLFLIPTGDQDDADLRATDAGTISHNSARPQPDPVADAQAVREACDYLSQADSADDLRTRWGNLPKHVQRQEAVIAAKDEAKEALTGAE